MCRFLSGSEASCINVNTTALSHAATGGEGGTCGDLGYRGASRRRDAIISTFLAEGLNRFAARAPVASGRLSYVYVSASRPRPVALSFEEAQVDDP